MPRVSAKALRQAGCTTARQLDEQFLGHHQTANDFEMASKALKYSYKSKLDYTLVISCLHQDGYGSWIYSTKLPRAYFVEDVEGHVMSPVVTCCDHPEPIAALCSSALASRPRRFQYPNQ